MILKEYLQQNGIRFTFFAKRVGVSQPALSAWMNGTVTPSIFYAHKIEQITKGEVKIKDWITEDIVKKRQERSKKGPKPKNSDALSDLEKSPEKLLS